MHLLIKLACFRNRIYSITDRCRARQPSLCMRSTIEHNRRDAIGEEWEDRQPACLRRRGVKVRLSCCFCHRCRCKTATEKGIDHPAVMVGDRQAPQLQNRVWIRDHRYHHVVIDQDLGSAPHPVGPLEQSPAPVLDPCCFLLTAPSQRRLSPTTHPIVTNLLGSRLDRFPGYDTDNETAGSLGDITQSQHQHYHHRREPEMVKDVVRPSAGTIVSGREKRGWRPRGGGAQQRCFIGLQQNFHGSDSPIPTALPRRKLHAEYAPPPFSSTTSPSSREKASCTPNITAIVHINQAAVKRPLSQIQVQTKEGPRGTRLLRCAWTTASVSG